METSNQVTGRNAISDFLEIKRDFFAKRKPITRKATTKKSNSELTRLDLGSVITKNQIRYTAVKGNCPDCDLRQVNAHRKTYCTIPKGMICNKGICFIYLSKLI